MKAVQVGILAALLVCAGLLYKVYRGQQRTAPAPAAPVAAAVTPAAPEPAPLAAAAEPAAPAPAAAVTPPAPEPVKAALAPRKPSPVREAKKRTPPVETARNSPAPEPAPAPAPQPIAAPPEPEAAPPAVFALNPPTGTRTAPPPPRTPHTVTIPVGALLTVRLAEALSSDKNMPGDVFPATLDSPLVLDGLVIAERGARVEGKVLAAEKAGRVRGVASLALHLTRVHSSDGQEIAIETARLAKEGPASQGEDARKVGVGAVLGAAIGAIAGGGKGAAIGAGAGGAAGAGAAIATRGKPVELPVETRLTFRIEQPVTLTERVE